jgi:hypothetical protein
VAAVGLGMLPAAVADAAVGEKQPFVVTLEDSVADAPAVVDQLRDRGRTPERY